VHHRNTIRTASMTQDRMLYEHLDGPTDDPHQNVRATPVAALEQRQGSGGASQPPAGRHWVGVLRQQRRQSGPAAVSGPSQGRLLGSYRASARWLHWLVGDGGRRHCPLTQGVVLETECCQPQAHGPRRRKQHPAWPREWLHQAFAGEEAAVPAQQQRGHVGRSNRPHPPPRRCDGPHC